MSEHIKNFVDNLSNGNNADAGEAFKDALRAKVADSLDQARVDIAGKIFTDTPGQDQAQPFSDPKPVVTDPAPETQTMMDTQGNEIAFEPNGNEQPTPESEVPAEAPANDESQPAT
tara:strand:+ start:389 stop:736 length:348 start_codon:yes stop_codon:yes gene_type:complete